MFNYTCLNPIAGVGLDLFSDDYKKVDDLAGADAALVRSAAMHDLDLPDSLLAVARAGAGVNNIPLDKCADKGIVVFNTPGANANGVKELVFAGMLYASRDIVGGIDWCLANQNDDNIAKTAEKAKKQFAGQEILGKKLGVIGLGAIGAEVANAALNLGMEVYGYDPYVSVNAAWRISSDVHHITDVDELFRTCDYLTIHVPAVEGTIGMINEHACSIMKEGAVFLNFSRDTLVDSAAMAAALENGKVKTYITDFATPEVMAMKNAIVLPHLGASTEEAEENCAMMAVKELRNYIENGNIVNSVNYPACDMGICADGNSRVAVLHRNVPNMIAQITNLLGEAGINIANLTNKARGEFAYTLVDTEAPVDEAMAEKLSAIESVCRVRVVK